MSRRQRNSHFQCQQFRIDQGGAAMKVTTDACALGAWVPLAGAERILDIGTGCGLLALFAAQRVPEARILGIELDPGAAAQAAANFAASPFADRLQLIEGDVRHYQDAPHDAILCNPPFFSGSTPNRCARLASARHDLNLSLAALLGAIARLLSERGTAWLLLPVDTAQHAAASAATSASTCGSSGR